MVAVSPSPSPFATLLRRSKFASFDPRIAQVFTTNGGDAHRGNWGLKRPLALRRRGACITVKSIDTSAQQTEWNSGENQVKFMKRYAELNVEPRRFDTRQRFDSEFAPGDYTGPEQTQLTLNPLRLRPSQFESYVERLREKRPAFIEYLRELGKDKSMYELAQQSNTDFHARFIADETAKTRESMESRAIDRSMHKSGGLIYSRPSPLQTYLTTKPLPGRILMDAVNYSKKQRFVEAYLVGFAGMTSMLFKRYVDGTEKKMNWKDDQDHMSGIAHFRMPSPRLTAAPIVVGKRQGLKGMKLRADVRIVDPTRTDGRSNMHRPGSAAYVNAPPPPRGKKGGEYPQPSNFITRPYVFKQFKPDPSVSAVETLEVLRSIIRPYN